MKQLFLISSLLFLLAACEKEETALAPPITNNQTPIDSSGGENIIKKGVLITSSVNIGSNYSKQIWYDLGTNKIIKTNQRADWDLAFNCNLNSNTLTLNAASFPAVAFTNTTDFDQVNSDAGLEYKYEHHSGMKDSMAIGDVSNLREVLIIDRGTSPAGDSLGKYKIQISAVDNGKYHLNYAKLKGGNKQTAVIEKAPQYNKVAFSFSTNESLFIEPPKTDYDLCFTQYTYIFTVPPQAYSVNGAVLNPYNTEVGKIFNKTFSKITKADAQSIFYADNLDIIGHHWKDYNLQKGTYEIYTKKNYLIKDASGNLFKLHFIDFYDENGIKGEPTFEYQRL